MNEANIMRQIRERVDHLLQQSTVALLWGDATSGGLSPLGTGSAFQVASETFLVTAAHVFTDHPGAGHVVPFHPSIKVSPEMWLTYEEITFSKTDDIAVARVNDQLRAVLAGIRPIRIDSVEIRPNERPHDVILLGGFPLELSGGKPVGTALSYATCLYQGPVVGLGARERAFDHDRQILLEYDWIQAVGEQGYAPGGPPTRLNGMSGCAVWNIGPNPLAHGWVDSDAKAIGVQTDTFSSESGRSVVRATRWGRVLGLIAKKYPGMARAMQVGLEMQGIRLEVEGAE